MRKLVVASIAEILSIQGKADTPDRRYYDRKSRDAAFRADRARRAREWNSKNPDRKRANDEKWEKDNRAEASLRYRQRQKEKNGNI